MSFTALLRAIKEKHLTPGAPKPVRTKMPLQLSQDSAVSISITPLILAEAAGSLFKSDILTDHKIVAVGEYRLFSTQVLRAYLSQSDGAFIQFTIQADTVIETRLYRQYDEVYPATSEDWAFWLAENDGYIGYPIMQSKAIDGDIPFARTIPGDQRIPPFQTTETLVGVTGFSTTMRHRFMTYSRVLTEPTLGEHLIVSAVETDSGASVNVWIGLAITATDLTVFAAADAPL